MTTEERARMFVKKHGSFNEYVQGLLDDEIAELAALLDAEREAGRQEGIQHVFDTLQNPVNYTVTIELNPAAIALQDTQDTEQE